MTRPGVLERMKRHSFLDGLRYAAFSRETYRPPSREDGPEKAAWLAGHEIGVGFRGSAFEPVPAKVAMEILPSFAAPARAEAVAGIPSAPSPVDVDGLSIECPHCDAPAGERCRAWRDGRFVVSTAHRSRLDAAADARRRARRP